MRAFHRTVLLVASAAAFIACGDPEPTAPVADDDSTILADGSAVGSVAAAGGALGATAMAPALPPELKLSDAQRAQITQLIGAFQDAVKGDMAELSRIQRDAEAAKRAGKSAAEIKAILDAGVAIRNRIVAAETKLRSDIAAVLTPAQRDWLKAHQPRECRPGAALTPAQQQQIAALIHRFEDANKADLQLVARVMDEARAAKAAGKTEAEIRAILQRASAAQVRLEAAHKQLQSSIEAILTPEQRASGCFTKGP